MIARVSKERKNAAIRKIRPAKNVRKPVLRQSLAGVWGKRQHIIQPHGVELLKGVAGFPFKAGALFDFNGGDPFCDFKKVAA